MVGAAILAGAAGGTASAADPSCSPGRAGAFGKFQAGQLSARECALQSLAMADDVPAVKSAADLLGGFYSRRAQRQQTMLDTGAGVTFVGALGAGFSGRVGVATQKAWLGGAFAPLVLTQHHSNEPTRDLFQAGALALALVSQRYATLHDLSGSLGAPAAAGRTACDQAESQLATVAGWPAGDDKVALLPEAQRAADACRDLSIRRAQLSEFLDSAKARAGALPRFYRCDVTRLDQRLIDRDRDFRYSPVETLSSLLATPLRTVDFLVTGTDTQALVGQMRVQTAFVGLDLRLTPLILPALPSPSPVSAHLAGPARARAFADDKGRPRGLTQAKVLSTAQALGSAFVAIQADERVLNTTLADAAVLKSAADATSLVFSYDNASRLANVTLRIPDAQAPSDCIGG